MKLLSVCVGQPQKFNNKARWTGIDKRPISGAVRVGRLGVANDHVMDKKHHGGPDQAVYIYTQLDYAYWADLLGQALPAGAFGENLLLSELESAPVQIGQRLRVGSVLLEASASRIPCQTFAAHMGDPEFARKFRTARRPGFYARVIEEGELRAGDDVTLEGTSPQGTPTVLDTFEFFYAKKPHPEQVQRLLAAPVAQRVREKLEKHAARFAV